MGLQNKKEKQQAEMSDDAKDQGDRTSITQASVYKRKVRSEPET
jgi:hypothetical protein